MAFVVVYDACVLHPTLLRDLLLRIANVGIVQAKWSDRILDECFESVRRARPQLDLARLARTRELMQRAFPDAAVTGYEALVDTLALVDPKDRHVVAAAMRAQAQVIVTFNLKHFPDHALAPYDLEAKHPDEFVLESIDIMPGAVSAIIASMAADLTNPPLSRGEILDSLRGLGLAQSTARLRDLMGL